MTGRDSGSGQRAASKSNPDRSNASRAESGADYGDQLHVTEPDAARAQQRCSEKECEGRGGKDQPFGSKAGLE